MKKKMICFRCGEPITGFLYVLTLSKETAHVYCQAKGITTNPIKLEDRGCFNCEARVVNRVPIVESGRATESAYWGIACCRQKLSDHYMHYVELRHVCGWHSDSIKDDARYPYWHDSIDLPKQAT